jgi:hypothetical protein
MAPRQRIRKQILLDTHLSNLTSGTLNLDNKIVTTKPYYALSPIETFKAVDLNVTSSYGQAIGKRIVLRPLFPVLWPLRH